MMIGGESAAAAARLYYLSRHSRYVNVGKRPTWGPPIRGPLYIQLTFQDVWKWYLKLILVKYSAAKYLLLIRVMIYQHLKDL